MGLVALAAGALFCFSGYRMFRLVIPIWGLFVGFGFGAGLVAAISGDRLLVAPLGWLLGLVTGLAFAALAYLYFEVAVILAMGSMGFAGGAAVMVALGVSWNWLIVLAGLALGTVLALVAIFTNLPRIVLVVVGATAGATAMIGGGMLLLGAMETADLTSQAVTDRIDDDWWWYLSYVVLVVAGILTQARANAEADLRAHWAAQARA